MGIPSSPFCLLPFPHPPGENPAPSQPRALQPRGSPALDPGLALTCAGTRGAARSGQGLRSRAKRASASRRLLPAVPPRQLVRSEPVRGSPRRQAPGRAGRGAGLRLSIRGRRGRRRWRRTLRTAGPGRGSLPASSPRTQGEPAESVRCALHTDSHAPQAPGGGRPLPTLSPPPGRGVEGPLAVPGVPPLASARRRLRGNAV